MAQDPKPKKSLRGLPGDLSKKDIAVERGFAKSQGMDQPTPSKKKVTPKKKAYDPEPTNYQRKAVDPEYRGGNDETEPDEAIAKQIRRSERAKGKYEDRQFDEPAMSSDGEDSIPSFDKARRRLRRIAAKKK